MNRNIWLVVVSVATSIGLMGCNEIETKDGRIPEKYLSYAMPLEGSYYGQFNGNYGTLTLKIVDRAPVVTFAGVNGGTDILAGCRGVIGKMISAKVVEKNKNFHVKYVRFSIDTGVCMYEGNRLTLEFSKDTRSIEGSIVTQFGEPGTPDQEHCYPRPNGGEICHRVPGSTGTPDKYVTGTFRKQ